MPSVNEITTAIDRVDPRSDEVKDILAELYNDTSLFAQAIFPESFYAPYSELHDEMWKLIDSESRRIVIAAPRFIGKTTMARTIAAKGMLFRDTRFLAYVSNSSTSAEMQTENLKDELLVNPRVRKLWGSIKAQKYDDIDEQFSKKAWIANSYTFVLPRGEGQQIRGLNWRGNRVNLFVVDDLEPTKTIGNEEIRRDRKKWFFGDLVKATDRLRGDWQIIYIDTFKHEDSLLANLLEDPGWDSLRLTICEEDLKSKAPVFMSSKEIKEEYDEHERQGILDVFYMEYMNKASATKDNPFAATPFLRYKETDEDFRTRLREGYIENVVLLDPAKTAKMKSADSAIVGWGIDRLINKWHIRDIDAGRYHPDEVVDHAIEMCASLNAHVLGVEVTSLNEFITYPILNEIAKRSLPVELVELKARGGTGQYAGKGKGKEGRVAGLAPFYRRGYVYHNETIKHKIEPWLLSFPKCKRWDVIDAAAYIVELLEMGLRYFTPIMTKEDEKEGTGEDVEAEYRELEKEYYEEGIDQDAARVV